METPLREPTFLILTALAGEPMHGYGLNAEVARLSDGRISLRPGTLYGALISARTWPTEEAARDDT
ncbi:hypothetical protein KRM28CT15_10590 [Krasilnikovia sp. M28-CT-15]